MPQQWFCWLLEKPPLVEVSFAPESAFYPDTSTSWRYRWGHYKARLNIKVHAPVYGVGECWQSVRLGVLWLAISQI
ncbi:hypothetical protein HK15_12830 [Acetobacter orientalis]|uniref:Uncharacterized protein n=1 Tax=Acetobacter orientalis TaxID=146474 RepID=A0A252B3I8_9PROT|nr:hypothetical protein HK15_12830 [Acetobacter orientalis]